MVNAENIKLCKLCAEAKKDPLRNPMHLVHPVSGRHMLFDTRSEAICPTCGARWSRVLNRVELVAQARR